MRCSAAFLFSGSTSAYADKSSEGQKHLLQLPAFATHRGSAHGRNIGHVEMCPPMDSGSKYTNSGRGRAPRPVTVRQLSRAALGMHHTNVCIPEKTKHVGEFSREKQDAGAPQTRDSTPSGELGGGNSACERRDSSRAAVSASRLGESTIQVDALPCHRVVVCGRIVRYIDAVANGSVAAAAEAAVSPTSSSVVPYDLLWISDTTGVVSVLRQRPSLAYNHAPPPLATPMWNVPEKSITSSERNSTFSNPTSGLLSGSDHSRPPCHVSAPQLTALCESKGSCTSFSSAAEGQQDSMADEEEAMTCDYLDVCRQDTITTIQMNCVTEDTDVLGINDYVICVGAVAFADVDAQMRRALKPYARDVREAMWAAATSTWSSTSMPPRGAAAFMELDDVTRTMRSHAREGDDSEAAWSEESTMTTDQRQLISLPPPKRQYVLLPGSEVPLTLEAARAELGLIGSLPVNTRYLSAVEAAQWGTSPFECAITGSTPPSFSASVPLGREVASKGLEDCDSTKKHPFDLADTDWVPLMGLRGQPRLVLDTNECLFWWLAAAEAHLRLCARTSEASTRL